MPILTFVQNYVPKKYLYISLHFLVEISISDSKTPRNDIAFHTSYDNRGRILINKDFYYGPLNAWIWLADERSEVFSGKRKENVVPGSSLDHIAWPYHFAKWCLLFQRSYNRKITKTHNDTGQTNKYSKQKDKIDRSFPCVCHKIKFYYVRKAHSILSLSPALGLSLTDTHIIAHTLNKR